MTQYVIIMTLKCRNQVIILTQYQACQNFDFLYRLIGLINHFKSQFISHFDFLCHISLQFTKACFFWRELVSIGLPIERSVVFFSRDWKCSSVVFLLVRFGCRRLGAFAFSLGSGGQWKCKLRSGVRTEGLQTDRVQRGSRSIPLIYGIPDRFSVSALFGDIG